MAFTWKCLKIGPYLFFAWFRRFFINYHIRWAPGVLSSGVERPGRKADHSLSSSAKDNNARSYTSTPPYVFMMWHLVKHRDNLYCHFPRTGTAQSVQWLFYGLDDRGSITDRDSDIFSSPLHSDRLGILPSPVSMCKGASFSRGKLAGAWGWPVTSI